jgi:hypothetical protein
MAWESRKQGKYLYVSVRSGHKVRKIYLGRGPHADVAAAALDAMTRPPSCAAAARDERAAEKAESLVADFHSRAEIAAVLVPGATTSTPWTLEET